ncbi:MAG: hypothetical protein A2087_04845 [Spirochaetes bacterium GWD1_61_31]|nr:MAG: hypothetical protein A2Y37_01615 [Spirochaetes bacterium GWB1_60_80]OHD34912.1 MAG: hypothetical protein A2004_00645 [Spirochaetes bacterium GWC1_61_12]OHD37059.1 MAG: hypothetical protein A2087_04845 [Spirochaetes bacterium GWD1_61_31]OHD45331.1 MAG: hypothetical protein A2Y35_00545 [Spirochaetes bacterium GWE1_60_18]OHD61083.1 MAG: hypothetical protein A2Y32_09230 [Spirochaetes bacterium GWF1_60_12]HAP42744.1 zinc/iron-chelating domain-containing protein [Spirochaetaceae bacterium]
MTEERSDSPAAGLGQADASLACRPGCGACCIAVTISSLGKAAGESCRYLTPDLRCTVFGQAGRPDICLSFQPSREMCGANRDEALAWLGALEAATTPPKRPTSSQGG